MPVSLTARVSRTPRRYLEYVRCAASTSRGMAAATGSVAALAAVIPLANVSVIGVVIGKIPAAVHGGAGSPAASSALLWTIAAGVLLAAQFVLGGLQTALATALGNRMDLALQRRLMDAVMRPAGVAHLEDPRTAGLVAIGGESFRAWLKPGRAAGALCALYTARLAQFGGCVLLALFNPYLAVLLYAASRWTEYEIRSVAKRETRHHLGANQLARRQDYFYTLGVEPPAAKEVRVFGLAGFLKERFAGSWRASERYLFADKQPRSIAATALLALAVLGELAWLTHRAVGGAVGIGWTSAYAQATVMTAAMVGAAAVSGTQAELALETFDRFQEAIGQLEAAGQPAPAPSPPLIPDRPLPARDISFEAVGFRYPGTERSVLAGLDLEIPVGKSLAIVGANGAGKTTLIKLLCRLYEPTEGRITVDGRPLAELDPAWWQRRIAAVFQDYIRYELPARTNIGLGHAPALDDLAGIEAAAEDAGIARRIAELPAGWETILASGYELGSELSGGEWQRVALARALFAVRHGAGVLILDEPAANLDARGEAELYRRFLSITEGTTTIVISHRFSTVRQASGIVVLAGGRVIERGTHEELLEQDGRYAKMFRLQAARFGKAAR